MATPKNRSILKAFTLLQAFRRPDEWLTSSELSRRAKMPEASGYRLVQTLEGIGAVVRDARGRYRPGMLLLELSSDINRQDLWRIAPVDVLERWSKQLDVTVQLGVFEEGMVTYVARAGRQCGTLALCSGMQFEAYCTGLGKVLLAALPDSALDMFFADGELVALTRQTITGREALRAELDQIRLRGYGIDDRETLDEVRCIAAPIRNPAGEVVAAISFSDDAQRMSDSRQEEMREELFAAATAVGERLYPWHRAPTVSRTRAISAEPCAVAYAGGAW